MPLSGGATDKFGNRYEGYWTVSCMVQLLEERADSIRLEPPGPAGRGIEFWIKNGLTREHHQVKRQHSGNGHWTLSDLERNGVLASFGSRLSNKLAYCTFVSSRSAHVLQELAERVRSAADYDEFRSVFLTSNDLAQEFGRLTATWQCAPDETFERLQRIRVVLMDEESLVSSVESRLSALLSGDPATALDVLAQFALNNVHNELTAIDIWNHLDGRGFSQRALGGNRSVLAAVEQATRVYLSPLRDALINADYVARPESHELVAMLTENTGCRGALILGGAGCGKSSLLWSLISELQGRGVPVLALRLDRLEPTLLPDQVGQALGLPGSPATVLGAVAKDRTCVLVIDQLDAVSLASGRHPQFFECVSEIIKQAEAFPHVRLLLACRKWDLENDHRFQRFTDQSSLFKQVVLGGLSRDAVKETLIRSGFEPDGVSEKQLELLSLPLHLSLLVEATEVTASPKDLSFLSTSTDLYDRFWNRKQTVLRQRLGRDVQWTGVVDQLCEYMSNRQCLSAPVSLLDKYPDADVKAMVSERVLIQDGRRVAFFHEGFFDYCFARRFASQRHQLLPFLRAGGQHLFRRAQLRQILHHEREVDWSMYLTNLQVLLRSEDIRYHLKQVVFGFLALVPDPARDEWRLLRPLLGNPLYRNEILRLLTVPRWFRLACDVGLVHGWLASGDEALENEALWLLRAVQQEEGDLVAELLEPLVVDDRWADRLPGIIQWSRLDSSRRFLDLFLGLLDKGTLDDARGPVAVNSDFWSLMYGLPKDHPDWASEVIGHYLQRRLTLTLEAGGRDPFDLETGKIPLTAHGGSIITDAARSAPQSFIRHVLPFAMKVIDLTARPSDDGLWFDQVWSFRVHDSGYGMDDYVLSGLQVAFTNLSLKNPMQFADLLSELRDLPYETIQFLLIKGLATNPAHFADLAVEYLAERTHRLSSGYSANPYWASRKLIQAVTPLCSLSNLRRLEEIILGYVPKRERDRKGAIGYAQYVLLGGLDPARRSSQATQRLQEWTRKFGEDIRRPEPLVMKKVGSPISESAAAKMTDAQWLKAMARYSSDTERIRRSGRIDGGAGELAHVLESETAKAPARFARLAQNMPDSINPAYFEAILRGVVNASECLTVDDTTNLCRRCHQLPGRPTGRWIHRPIVKLAKLNLPTESLDIVVWYALNDPNPEKEFWREVASQGIPFYRGDMLTAGLNSVRGDAIHSVGSLIYADPRRARYLATTVVSASQDRMLAVRSWAAHAVGALLLHDRDLAVRTFLSMCETDDELLATRFVEHFLHYSVPSHFSQLEPILRRMISSRKPAVAKVGARQACLASLSLPEAKSLAETCMAGWEPLRIGAAQVFAANVGLASLRDLCEENLLTLANDDSEQVRQKVAQCFYRSRDFDPGQSLTFVAGFVETRAFAEQPDSLIRAFEQATERLPEVALKVCERFVANAGAATGDIRTREAAGAYSVSKLVLRLYNQAISDADKNRCLDLIDEMARLRALGIQDELNVFDR